MESVHASQDEASVTAGVCGELCQRSPSGKLDELHVSRTGDGEMGLYKMRRGGSGMRGGQVEWGEAGGSRRRRHGESNQIYLGFFTEQVLLQIASLTKQAGRQRQAEEDERLMNEVRRERRFSYSGDGGIGRELTPGLLLPHLLLFIIKILRDAKGEKPDRKREAEGEKEKRQIINLFL